MNRNFMDYSGVLPGIAVKKVQLRRWQVASAKNERQNKETIFAHQS
jgi:hypothetical protein